MQRRHWMFWAAATAVAGSTPSAARAAPVRLAAAWRRGEGHQAGVLCSRGGRLGVELALGLPSRPHAVRVDAEGCLLVVARRPGDWLLRWNPGTGVATWEWIEPDRCFNGHVLPSLDGRRLFTPETDMASGLSVLGVRDARTLAKLAEWPTGGSDAHDLIHDDDGHLVLANGGVTLLQDTGRLKRQLGTMESSLVRLDATDGHVLGRWRLHDHRLSLRHLAWGPRDAQGRRMLGVALQAEHADPARVAAAPVLAVFDGQALRTCEAPTVLAGYGGDIAATAEGFAVSCPRAGVVARWHADGRWGGQHPQAHVCALSSGTDAAPGPVWAGGESAVAWGGPNAEGRVLALPGLPPLRLDNHWALLQARGGDIDHVDHTERREAP